jgi:phospholipid/cholesterol/gamma-HCH transport system ATP-binding protein
MIEILDLHKSFDQNHVLKGVNLKVHDGKSMVIIGASGQGKSVILKCLLGLSRPNSGKVLLNGIDPNSAQKNIILSKVGMLFQGGALFDSLPIWQNVAFRYLHGKQKINANEAKKIAIEKLERVGLKESFANNFPSELSGGMQKRVALARAIATQPEIIFFDEPTTGLDPIMAQVINDLIRELVVELGVTAVTITHDIQSVRSIADEVSLLHDGIIQWSGTLGQLDKSNNEYLKQFIVGSTVGPIDSLR